jgi:hypothetical protein
VEVKEEVEKPNPFWVMVFVRALSQFLYTYNVVRLKKGVVVILVRNTTILHEE